MSTQIEWEMFEQVIDNFHPALRVLEDDNYYYVYAKDEVIDLWCTVDKNPTDPYELNEFLNDYLPRCNERFSDDEHAPFVRIKIHDAGNAYKSKSISFTTSTLNSLNSMRYDGTQCPYTTLKFFDADGVELTTQETIDTDCVVTQMDFQPPIKYEIIAGSVSIAAETNDDYIGFIRIAPGLQGGDRDVLEGMNLKFLKAKERVCFDAKVAELMPYYEGTTSNMIRTKIVHPAGGKLTLSISMELYV